MRCSGCRRTRQIDGRTDTGLASDDYTGKDLPLLVCSLDHPIVHGHVFLAHENLPFSGFDGTKRSLDHLLFYGDDVVCLRLESLRIPPPIRNEGLPFFSIASSPALRLNEWAMVMSFKTKCAEEANSRHVGASWWYYMKRTPAARKTT